MLIWPWLPCFTGSSSRFCCYQFRHIVKCQCPLHYYSVTQMVSFQKRNTMKGHRSSEIYSSCSLKEKKNGYILHKHIILDQLIKAKAWFTISFIHENFQTMCLRMKLFFFKNAIQQTSGQLQMEKSDLTVTLERKSAEIDRLGGEQIYNKQFFNIFF